jgi:hypothetical protein
MQISESICAGVRRTKFHLSAKSRVDHPVRQCYDCTPIHFDVQHIALTSAALFVQSQPAPIVGMPAVVNLNLLADMGRMTLR